MSHRILIIDDEEDIRAVAAMALDFHAEMDVRTCGSGMEGQQIAEWWQPHLILLDVRMPGMTGPQTLETLRNVERTASIPVIFFTASVQAHEKEGLIALGVEGLISKPFDAMTLADLIKPYLPNLAASPSSPANEASSATMSDDVTKRPKPVKSLLYVSRSLLRKDETGLEIEKIVATARDRNHPLDVTGALIFTHTHFAQFLEGPSEAVDRLMATIKLDPRHEDVRIVPTPECTRPKFANWSMAYGGSSVFVSRLVTDVFDARSATSDPEKLIRLMREFTNDLRSVA